MLFSVAPMMDWTDRHCRVFHRTLTQHALLYTEMVTVNAVLFGDSNHLLGYSPVEHPIALQLGGDDPKTLAEVARIGADWGYDEINLNCGCPSDRVQSGHFGACLMANPDQVARCIEAMKQAVSMPVSVKCRIGIDEQDGEKSLDDFVVAVANAGVDAIIVHARKAWLKGLSPKENRTIPPLNYDRVYRLKQNFPHLWIALNGGITTFEEAQHHLTYVDGVMMGRQAYQRPALLREVDHLIYGDTEKAITLEEAVMNLLPYMEAECANGVPLHRITRHMVGLFHGCRGARSWRRALTGVNKARSEGGMISIDTLLQALEHIDVSKNPSFVL